MPTILLGLLTNIGAADSIVETVVAACGTCRVGLLDKEETRGGVSCVGVVGENAPNPSLSSSLLLLPLELFVLP